MSLDIQFKLKSNELYLQYLHSHSYWYKILNRSPESFNSFVEKVKEDYHLRPIDRINKTIDTIDMVSSIISSVSVE